MTPYLRQPLLFGADVIVHSPTECLGGARWFVGLALWLLREKEYTEGSACPNAGGPSQVPKTVGYCSVD